MAIAHEIAAFDIVELTERVDDAPAGARGGVLEISDDGIATIEVMEPVLGPAQRIVFASLDVLRIVRSSKRHAS